MSQFKTSTFNGTQVTVIDSQISLPLDVPALVFIHGMWGSANIFTNWLEKCVELGVWACAVSLPRNESTTFTDYVRNVEDALKTIDKARPITLVGHSLGGLIAQVVASRNVGRVKNLVTVASAPPRGIVCIRPFWLKPQYLWAAATGKLFNLGKKDAMNNIFDRFDSPIAQMMYDQLIQESGKVLLQVALGIPVQKLSQPMLVVSAAHDRVLPASVQMKIAQKYDAEYKEFYMGHATPIEDVKGRVIRYIAGWVKGLDPQEILSPRWSVPVKSPVRTIPVRTAV